MKKKRLWTAAAAICFTVAIAALFIRGPLKGNLFGRQGMAAFAETLLFFAGLTAAFHAPIKKEARLAGAGLVFLAVTWCHQVFLPFLLSGAWFFGLLLLGGRIRQFSAGMGAKKDVSGRKSREEDSFFQALIMDFILGSGAWISITCLLSAFRFGGLSRMRLLAAALVLVLSAEKLVSLRPLGKPCAGRSGRPRISWGSWEYFFLAIAGTMVLLQLARLNLQPDYDSLHYGLRSQYVLDNGNGIYENLGNINLVYTYPKGFEILTFPLSGTNTYGYVLCFNVWLTILVLVLAGGLAAQLSGSGKKGMGAAAFLSLVPGVMNMAVTAKSDTATLACQLCILCSGAGLALEEETGQKQRWFACGVGSCFLSFAMKPTALVFSTISAFACMGYLLAKGEGRTKRFWKFQGGERACLLALGLLGLGAWAGTWIRTYRMTGVPATSVFTSVWERLGFKVRWPYAFSAIPDQGLELGAAESLRFLAGRLFCILFAPVGEDMSHVMIAWGSSLLILWLLAWILWGREWKRQIKGSIREKAAGCVFCAFAAVGCFSLASIYLLWQVDGNYFMLFYALAAVFGTLAMGAVPGNLYGKGMVFSFLFQVMVALSANWAGTVGFTPLQIRHKGYQNHRQLLYEEMCGKGNQAIWNILASDPTNRVLAVGEHPEVLQFPCNVQSYYDLTGSGGNVRLVKTLDDVKAFLRFAGIKYLYVQAGFLEEGTRCYDVVRYLAEDGSLADIRYEYGNMLAVVDLDGMYDTDIEKAAREFYQNIKLNENGGIR